MTKNFYIVAILPAYNEALYLDKVLKKIQKYAKTVVVVDDGSIDRTSLIAFRYTQHVLRHAVNLGKGAAMKTGAEYAFYSLGADAIVYLDADDQHDPAELPRFYTALNSGAEVVLGVRDIFHDMPILRSIGNRFASYIIWLCFGVYIADIPSGYKAMSREAYEKLLWNSSDYAVEMEIAARIGKTGTHFKTILIQTIYHDTTRGMTMLDLLGMGGKLLSWRLQK